MNEMGKTKSYGTKLRNALRNQRTSKRRPLSTLDAQQKAKILKWNGRNGVELGEGVRQWIHLKVVVRILK